MKKAKDKMVLIYQKTIANVRLPYAIICICAVMIIAEIPKCVANAIQLKTVETLVKECDDSMAKIEALENENQLLEDEIDDNITRIFTRVCEIEKEHPDEIRGTVIQSVKKDMAMDAMTRKASVLALLSNYEELENDIEVQMYLSRNMDIMLEVNKNLVLIDNNIFVFEQCSEKIATINDTETSVIE